MPVTSETRRWTGRSGRVYGLLPEDGVRDGGMATIRRVEATGVPMDASTVAAGTVLALKLARPDDRMAVEAIAREVETLASLSKAPGSPPCPRLYDVVGEPPIGLVMEWCPTDMERWWEGTWSQPRAFVLLCEAMADTCRRVREYEAVSEMDMRRRVIHADIKPRNVLRAVDGRWLLTDFGAAKSRSVEDASWTATRVILGTENFIAPEAVFNARKPHPAAMDTWSLGCSFFALLRMRTWLRGGQKMPANGTHAHAFRTQRVALITDLQQRKPTLFADRELDPALFTSPDRVPDKDRKAVAESLEGIFGEPANPTLEGVLAGECVNLLDRALRIDPAARFRDPLGMAAEFEALAQRYRELALRAEGGASGRIGGTGPPLDPPRPPPQSLPPHGLPPHGLPQHSLPPPAAPPMPASAPTPTSAPLKPVGGATGAPSAPRYAGDEEMSVEDGSGRRGAANPGLARVPGWVGVGLFTVLVLQGLQLLVGAVTLLAVMNADAQAPAPIAQPAPVAQAAPSTPAPAAAAPSASAQDVLADVPVEPALAAPPVATPPAAAAPATTVASASPARPAAKTAAPGPKRVGTPVADVSGTGLVLVSGAQAYLLGPGGKHPPGTVPAGSYELFVQAGASPDFASLGQVTVITGERLVYRCGLGTCKRVQ